MAESFTDKRAVLPKGQQRKIMDKAIESFSVEKIANIFSVSGRTIRDWRREKFSIDADILNRVCKKIGISFPRQVKLKDRYWYTLKGSSAGGAAAFKKYGRVGGDPEYRKKKWREWWEGKGKHEHHPIINTSLPIKKPVFSEKLAELVGILLGDGSTAKYQIVVTLCDKDEKPYGKFVSGLIKKLFDVPVNVNRRAECSVINIAISRVELVRFCVNDLKLKRGSKIKHQVDIPNWIKANKLFLVSCVRGLIDTDGTVFNHKYRVRGKEYCYKKISFTSRSEPLRQSVFCALLSFGIKARLTKQYDVRIDAQEDVKKYFRIVGSHNLRILMRYKK